MDFVVILGPEGPETPVNGRSGRKSWLPEDLQKVHGEAGGMLAPELGILDVSN